MKKLTLVLMAFFLGVLLTALVFVFGPRYGIGPGYGPGYGMGQGYYGKVGFDRLKLSDDQKTKIEALVTAGQKEIKPITEKMFDKSVELRRLWRKENPDKDKILTLQKEERTLRDTMEDKTTALRFEIRKVLTPEQNEKLASFGWGMGPGFGPRGNMIGPGRGGFAPGMGMFN
jgi:Spy/CpxP family protein refolding chaperone